MIDKETRNKNLIKRIVQICFALVAVICGEFVSTQWLEGSLLWQCIVTVIIMILFVPLDIFIENKIEEKKD